jgi:glycosyltransferase involved in cell wall biosynthesis
MQTPTTQDLSRIAVIIPALNPVPELIRYVAALLQHGVGRVVLVNDGSHAAGRAVFAAMPADPRVTVLVHAINFGKGRALKTAFNHCLAQHAELLGVVTADADGQHSVADVIRVASTLLQRTTQDSQSMVLGVRQFDKNVPFRSQAGNQLTKVAFRALYGVWISDTQTGLRGFPLAMLPMLLKVEGERYEYESSVLIAATTAKRAIVEVPIATIYIDGNQSSHFNVLKDSMRIYFVLLRFFFASLLTSLIDFVVFMLALAFSSNLLTAMLYGRGVALCFNFVLNKHLVFRARHGGASVFLRYLTLVVLMAALSYVLIDTLQAELGFRILSAKLLAESVLFMLSFSAQRELVFAGTRADHETH